RSSAIMSGPMTSSRIAPTMVASTGSARRVHPRMSGDPCRPQAQGHRCDRRSVRPVYLRGIPAHIRSDNGPEFVEKAVQDWIAVAGAKTAYIERGSLGERLHRELQCPPSR